VVMSRISEIWKIYKIFGIFLVTWKQTHFLWNKSKVKL
jgi:hypothetical protein